VLHKKAVRRAAENGGASCRKGQPSGPPFSAAQLNVQPAGLHFPQPSLMCSSLAHPVVQPASPPFCAARQSAENSCFVWPHSPPALRLVLPVRWRDKQLFSISTPALVVHPYVGGTTLRWWY